MIQLSVESFKRALALLQYFASIKSFHSTEGMVRLKLQEDGMLELSMISEVSSVKHLVKPLATTYNVFDVLAPYDVLTSTVRALTTDTIDLVQDFSSLLVKTSGGKYKMAGQNEKEFPVAPILQGESCPLTLSARSSAISRVAYCVSNDELRPSICGVLLDPIGEGRVNAVATDGHRIAIYETDLAFIKEKVILHVTAFKAIQFMSQFMNQVNALVSDRYLMIYDESTSIIVKLVQEEYPLYRNIIPTYDDPIRIAVNQQDCTGTVRRAALYSNRNTNAIGLRIKGDALTIMALDQDTDKSFREILFVDHDGKDGTIAFNGNYLRDMLGAIQGDKARISFVAENRGAIITDDSDRRYFSILMPIAADFDAVT